MKNVSSLKSNAINSPKTPGGISKSLLTPCRRVGLSRNWKNKGPSPFISPLSGYTQEVKEEKVETRKRKQRVLQDNVEKTPETCTADPDEVEVEQSNDLDKTPSRNVELPRRKKSKTLLASINKSQEDTNTHSEVTSENVDEAVAEVSSLKEEGQNDENIEEVSTPVRTKSKKSKKRSPRLKTSSKDTKTDSKPPVDTQNAANTETPDKSPEAAPDMVYQVKEKSPNDLRKECIVVIQRKIFKKTEDSVKEVKETKSSSQALFDSDSDEVPLIQLNKETKNKTDNRNCITEQKQINNKVETVPNSNEDDDFIDKSTKIHTVKNKDAKPMKNKLKTNKNTKVKPEKVKEPPKPSSQSSFDDDDDFDNSKKTILIRKTYEKVSKPLKAKSTGSITQKDIDELRARIEVKKKLLLAQSINPETEELTTLIKKWQKGCQEALKELLDLMKTKFHDKQDMDYSEMLQTLKIPPSLVGYDAENDCFNEPNDASIILGQFEDL
uniref:Swi5-dependent recombination DNA repair protein 1 homolog n=1 Tax=Heliothis virescens TaxID=7102 RepID=A0A2A4JU92_HELVI